MKGFPFIEKADDGIDLSILLLPRSSVNAIAGVHDGLLKVRVSSPPVDGLANSALVKFFAKLLKVPRSDISIVRGERSKRKRVRILNADFSIIMNIIKSHV